MSETKNLNFIEEIISQDLASGKYDQILTRFPPEPNGYLHIGHAKSICLNFGLSAHFGGGTNLRFDDTNPATEETEYVESIKADLQWLGFRWVKECYASDYFDTLYGYAVQLIEKGLAYVDDSSPEEIALQKGTPTAAGKGNEFRNRSIEENLELFTQMKLGKFKDGSKVLRAKIDLASPNMILRDPILYRIKRAHHHRTQDKWCIYPMYDFAHGQSDSIEKITHSICTLEFTEHRALYDWCIAQLGIFPSKQYEFARLNITYTVLSKRKLLQLVQEGFVESWDDPRMPTISGMRRRGYTAQSIREFCDRIGIAKRENIIDFSLLEFCVREHLNKIAQRRMVVSDPIKLIITNYDKGEEILLSENNPEEEQGGVRNIPFSKELWIQREDFMENPTKKYFRLGPGLMVRLKSAYIVKCENFDKDAQGQVQTVYASYIPESKSGADTSGIQVKGTLHWVSAKHAVPVVLNEYDRLFKVENVDQAQGDFKEYINEKSLASVPAWAEPAVKNDNEKTHFQFLRKGYFYLDTKSTSDRLIFNRTVTLKDTWAKEQKNNQ